MYPCPRETCKGFHPLGNVTGNASCWHQSWFPDGIHDSADYQFDDEGGCFDQGKVLCTQGANGPLCGTCE
jgi:hypothetical protein